MEATKLATALQKLGYHGHALDPISFIQGVAVGYCMGVAAHGPTDKAQSAEAARPPADLAWIIDRATSAQEFLSLVWLLRWWPENKRTSKRTPKLVAPEIIPPSDAEINAIIKDDATYLQGVESAITIALKIAEQKCKYPHSFISYLAFDMLEKRAKWQGYADPMATLRRTFGRRYQKHLDKETREQARGLIQWDDSNLKGKGNIVEFAIDRADDDLKHPNDPLDIGQRTATLRDSAGAPCAELSLWWDRLREIPDQRRYKRRLKKFLSLYGLTRDSFAELDDESYSRFAGVEPVKGGYLIYIYENGNREYVFRDGGPAKFESEFEAIEFVEACREECGLPELYVIPWEWWDAA